MPSLLAPSRTALAVLALSILTSFWPSQAGAQATASVQVFAFVVPRVTTNAIRTGATAVRPIAGGVVVTQQMAIESTVDSQALEAEFTPVDDAQSNTESGPIAVSVRCGGHAGRCRLSGGTTPRIAIEVELRGMTPQAVERAISAPERFAAGIRYRLVRGEGV